MTTLAHHQQQQQSQGTGRPEPVRVPRVLLLTHRLPYPPDRGDRIRSYHLVKLLSAHTHLGIACTSNEPVWLQHHQLLRTMAERVVIQPVLNVWGGIRGTAAFLAGRAVTPACFYRQGLADSILQWHEQKPFDVVLTFCTGMVHYARLLTDGPGRKFNPGIRHVLDLVDVDSLKWRAYARSSYSPLRIVYGAEARRLGRIESGAEDRFDAITVVSENEARAYREHVGDHPRLTVVRNGVNLDYFHPLSDVEDDQGEGPGDPGTLAFVGVLNYKPNVQGIRWFVKRVMPLLRARIRGAKLLVVGRHPSRAVKDLQQHPGVEVVGSVPDVRTYIARASVVIAPLLIARGVQNKVLEAMASQRVVVCSPQAASGIDTTEGRPLLVAESPDQWVEHLSHVMTDRVDRTKIAQAGRRYVEQHCSWEQCLRPMLELLGAAR